MQSIAVHFSTSLLPFLTSVTHIDQAYAANHAEVLTGQYVAICISDTGVGMAAATVNQALRTFFHKGQATWPEPGLRFRQAKRRPLDYSEVGQSATVKLYLPRLLADPVAAQSLESTLPAEGSTEETILVLSKTMTTFAPTP
jgi:hypothetical protein